MTYVATVVEHLLVGATLRFLALVGLGDLGCTRLNLTGTCE